MLNGHNLSQANNSACVLIVIETNIYVCRTATYKILFTHLEKYQNFKSVGSVSTHLLLMGWIEKLSNECDYPNAKLDENVMIKGQRVELWKDGEWENTNNKY